MAVKSLQNIPIRYSILFVPIVFVARMQTYISNDLPVSIEMITKGDFFNVHYGLLASIFYFYDPIFR